MKNMKNLKRGKFSEKTDLKVKLIKNKQVETEKAVHHEDVKVKKERAWKKEMLINKPQKQDLKRDCDSSDDEEMQPIKKKAKIVKEPKVVNKETKYQNKNKLKDDDDDDVDEPKSIKKQSKSKKICINDKMTKDKKGNDGTLKSSKDNKTTNNNRNSINKNQRNEEKVRVIKKVNKEILPGKKGKNENKLKEKNMKVETLKKNKDNETNSKKLDKNVTKNKRMCKDDDDEEEDEDDDEEEEEEMEVENESADESDDDDESDSDDLDDSDSSSSSSSDDEEEEDVEEVPWGEFAINAPTTEETTHRLALCNMDWDHIKAVDLFVVFNSFKPLTGVMRSLKIYPSAFGLERMKCENESGPSKLIGYSKDETQQLINLRKYEMDKLKYYFAVIDCDTPETADWIYKNCDGTEFLNSGVVIDLRFIPDDMTFENEPKSEASFMPHPGTYHPPKFENKALHHTNVSLTWDETPEERFRAFKNWDEKTNLEEFETKIKDYLAPPSEDEEEDDDNDDVERPKKRSFHDTIALYKNLLKEINDGEVEEAEEKEKINKEFMEEFERAGKGDKKSKESSGRGKKVEEKEEDDDDEEDEEMASGDGSEESDEEEKPITKMKGRERMSSIKFSKLKAKEKMKEKMAKQAQTSSNSRFNILKTDPFFAMDSKKKKK